MFEQREIAPAVWVPIRSLGPAVRKGRNSLRIEFEPADALAGHHARLSWALVNDQAAEKSSEGAVTSTNQSGEGAETKQGKGKVVLEREFEADFAASALAPLSAGGVRERGGSAWSCPWSIRRDWWWCAARPEPGKSCIEKR